MKKTAAIMLAMALLLGVRTARAATMEATVMLEGMPEKVTLTLHESALGYSLWVDMDRFAWQPAGDTDLFRPSAPGAVDAQLAVTLMRSEDSLNAAGRRAAALMVENGYKVEKSDGSALFPAYSALGYYGKQGGLRQECYVVETSRG